MAATASGDAIARVEFYAGGTLVGTATAPPYAAIWSAQTAGTFLLTAVAYDSAGVSTTSPAVSMTMQTTPAPPTRVAFQASLDHATLVTSYRLEIFARGADVNTATPIASSELGMPAVDASNEITVDQAAFFSSLAPGDYIATVSAVGATGSGRSMPPSPFSR
jgi:hypothetical protein